jgi:hypothetical protein
MMCLDSVNLAQHPITKKKDVKKRGNVYLKKGSSNDGEFSGLKKGLLFCSHQTAAAK